MTFFRCFLWVWCENNVCTRLSLFPSITAKQRESCDLVFGTVTLSATEGYVTKYVMGHPTKRGHRTTIYSIARKFGYNLKEVGWSP